jgi:hypothetical protein
MEVVQAARRPRTHAVLWSWTICCQAHRRGSGTAAGDPVAKAIRPCIARRQTPDGAPAQPMHLSDVQDRRSLRG